MNPQTPHNPTHDPTEGCNCEELLEHLYEFVDSEMSQNDVTRLRRHVADCHTCQEATDVETKVRLLLRRSCVEVAPQTLRMRVVAQLSVLRAGGTSVP